MQNELLEREHQAALEQEALRNQKKKKNLLEISDFNQSYLKQKNALRAKELELERQITEAANEGLAEEKRRATEVKQKNQQDMLEYMQFLKKLREDEKLMNAELDRLRLLEQDAAFAKRSVQWDKETRARETLMAEVVATREQQLREKGMHHYILFG